MAKEFKKGQVVIHFSNYDSKGTWSWTRAVVKSCGNVKMTLENAETGAMMGANFFPDSRRTYIINWKGEEFIKNYAYFTLADMTDAEAHSIAVGAAMIYLADQRKHYAACLAQGNGAGYDAAINKEAAQLHEPRSLKR